MDCFCSTLHESWPNLCQIHEFVKMTSIKRWAIKVEKNISRRNKTKLWILSRPKHEIWPRLLCYSQIDTWLIENIDSNWKELFQVSLVLHIAILFFISNNFTVSTSDWKCCLIILRIDIIISSITMYTCFPLPSKFFDMKFGITFDTSICATSFNDSIIIVVTLIFNKSFLTGPT